MTAVMTVPASHAAPDLTACARVVTREQQADHQV